MGELSDQTMGVQKTGVPYPPQGNRKDQAEMPHLDPGELAPFWATPYQAAKLSPKAENCLKGLCDLVGNKDVAARRWEVEQALALDTPVWTTEGRKSCGDLREGDWVFGSDGLPVRVVKALPEKLQASYRLLFDDGESIVAGALHLWPTRTMRERKNGWEGKNRTTRELAETLHPNVRSQSGYANHSLPMVELLGADTELPVDPYVLGCWLGDGIVRDGYLFAGASDAGFMANQVLGSKRVSIHKNGCETWSVPGLRSGLKNLGILNAKRIPQNYLFAGKRQRISLLQGMMDTDGHCARNGVLTWAQSPRAHADLIDDMEFLLSSLGIKFGKQERYRRAFDKIFPIVKLCFTADFDAFRLPRKLERQRAARIAHPRSGTNSRKHRRFLVEAKPVGECRVRCIGVDASDHLFLAGNKLVPTHNSWEARLYDRGYQYLLPRKGGGWIMPPFATDYNRGSQRKGGQKWYGYETNIYTTYGEIITAALTRDIPAVRFFPEDPTSDADITAAKAANNYSRIFSRNNDLLDLQHQLVYYLRTDGRAVIVVNHVLDAQRFGREDMSGQPEDAVPEDVASLNPNTKIYLLRHGETEMNAEGKMRGRSEVPLDERGEREVQRAAEWLKGKGIRTLLTSPVDRAMQTAEIVSSAIGIPALPDDRLASLDVGDLEGESSTSGTDTLKKMSEEEPDAPIGGTGESFNDFNGRVKDALFEALQASDSGPVALVTHDSVISAIFRLLHGEDVPPDAQIPAGGVAGVVPMEDGTYSINTVWPYLKPIPSTSQLRGAPRGKEIAEVYGKLEAKVPINAEKIEDFPFLQVSKEYDYAYVKGMFPDKAEKIRPGSAGAGENELDRIARINACLSLEASYVTGDSMVRDCTVQRTWFRPAMFMEVEDMTARVELLEAFPNGCLCVIAGEAFIFSRQESMDDHCTLVQAFPGSGQNRIALCSKLLSIQKRVNNWIDLLNDYFIRCVPIRWISNALGDPEAITDQSSVPGSFVFYDPSQLVAQAQTGQPPIFVEPVPVQNPAMPEFIQFFINQLPQLLVGALPSLFGANANTDTVGGIAIQRDQALGRLGTPWHAIQVATARYFRQAVALAAQMRTKPLMGIDKDRIIRVELSQLKGNILAFPEEDSNFPESWVQKQARYQMLLTDAANPLIQQFLTATPQNLRTAVRMAGIQELDMPQADSWEKQMGEIDVMLKTGPVPNPAWRQAHAVATQMAQQVATAHAAGQMIPPQALQEAQQAQQQAAQVPQFLSSLPIDAQVDDNGVEAQTCGAWLNSPMGRAMKNGSPQEKMAYENVKLHFLEHKQAVASMVPASQHKDPSVSMNYKDLPPPAAAALLAREGLPANPMDVANNRLMEERLKHPTELGAMSNA